MFVNYTSGSAGHTAQAANHPTLTKSGHYFLLYLIGELNATVLAKINYNKYRRQQ
jgi:hypothetical protein